MFGRRLAPVALRGRGTKTRCAGPGAWKTLPIGERPPWGTWPWSSYGRLASQKNFCAFPILQSHPRGLVASLLRRFHSRAIRCVSAIWAGVILAVKSSRAFIASLLPQIEPHVRLNIVLQHAVGLRDTCGRDATARHERPGRQRGGIIWRPRRSSAPRQRPRRPSRRELLVPVLVGREQVRLMRGLVAGTRSSSTTPTLSGL